MPFCDREIQDILEPVFSSTDAPWWCGWKDWAPEKVGDTCGFVTSESESRNSGPRRPSQCSPHTVHHTVPRSCLPRHRIWQGERVKSSLHSPTGRCKTCPPAHPSPLTLCPPLSRSQPVPKMLTPCRPAPPSRLSGPLSGMLSRGSARWFLCAPQDAAERSRHPLASPSTGKSGHTLRPHGPPSQPALLSRHHWHAGLLPAVVFTAASPGLRMVPHT